VQELQDLSGSQDGCKEEDERFLVKKKHGWMDFLPEKEILSM
jgi:hypothetical protein